MNGKNRDFLFNDHVLAKSRDWYHMSKRLKKKYNIERKEV